MLCHVCKGSGCLLVFRDGRPEYWSCPACGDAGVLAQHGPAIIGGKHSRKKEASVKIN